MIEASIIICTYNRDRYLSDALESFPKQSLSAERFEIIVVNNNCTDGTAKICSDFSKRNPLLNFVEVVEERQGLSNARNKGIQSANSEIIAFMDDDAIATDDYIEQILFYKKKYSDYNAFGGKVIPVYEGGEEPEWMSKYLERLVSKVDYGDKPKRFPLGKYPVGCNMIFRKHLFDKYGGFNPELKERSDDKYIFSKLYKNGEIALYTPGIFLYHNIESFRTQKEFIIKLSQKNGVEERNRVKDRGYISFFLKLIDYFIKLGISYLLAIGFLLKRERIKGKYLIMVFKNSIIGYLRGNLKDEN